MRHDPSESLVKHSILGMVGFVASWFSRFFAWIIAFLLPDATSAQSWIQLMAGMGGLALLYYSVRNQRTAARLNDILITKETAQIAATNAVAIEAQSHTLEATKMVGIDPASIAEQMNQSHTEAD